MDFAVLKYMFIKDSFIILYPLTHGNQECPLIQQVFGNAGQKLDFFLL